MEESKASYDFISEGICKIITEYKKPLKKYIAYKFDGTKIGTHPDYCFDGESDIMFGTSLLNVIQNGITVDVLEYIFSEKICDIKRFKYEENTIKIFDGLIDIDKTKIKYEDEIYEEILKVCKKDPKKFVDFMEESWNKTYSFVITRKNNILLRAGCVIIS